MVKMDCESLYYYWGDGQAKLPRLQYMDLRKTIAWSSGMGLLQRKP